MIIIWNVVINVINLRIYVINDTNISQHETHKLLKVYT